MNTVIETIKKVSNQQLYDRVREELLGDAYVSTNGFIRDDRGRKSFLGLMFTEDQIDRLDGLASHPDHYHKFIWPTIFNFFEEPAYAKAVEDLHDDIDCQLGYVEGPYWYDEATGQIQGCEINLIAELNAVSKLFGVVTKEVGNG